ncbi:RNA polymerase sigma factor [Leptolyngbya boryana NIES-2135]|jgi:RNA polymerase sigma-70 factor (ECF subfamily)|uniref:RNA polymerase sigma factor n=1 Tax=Leptolyngbya boryana NIES-2135 TaxID=1973484 RepID=A0A1Z4JHF2_LEPBY|nr:MULTISPECIES: sigma-70 family RNA polymerase sigma factor [Leptolyngbya]BAY56098.1 RNA polymerase sigma factor [Leptolyngbya boryana NIES-2135]MBD2366209.1 sigma-70 family RNA polymerase sigma factor [Leptolyngbya sp. FACHB-161]MBD2372389.1 sigma-70 family RNA polymerase sigma factor [Leptolyngbya sp. FACHB-238]MBD2396812.1 sigma-70 family RNA polymerase sigma factor [Leptolyngbya sp. FACHB-239]MBD2403335.1 sigma-70 family RNA polymerase sigma factor [Leptolyngbya sp. FACHB-402]
MPSEPSANQASPESNQTDAELILALSNGQTVALGVLYDRHARLVYGIALNTLGNAQEAEDLTQDIFLTLAKGTTYDPKRGSLRTFLAILTRSRARDRLRSRNSARQTLDRWKLGGQAESAPNVPLERAFQHEQSQEVRNALAQLSDDQQQILKMAYYDGLSQSEIAKQLEIPLGTVKGRARTGLLKLRKALTSLN